jgi:hypothetical protein
MKVDATDGVDTVIDKRKYRDWLHDSSTFVRAHKVGLKSLRVHCGHSRMLVNMHYQTYTLHHSDGEPSGSSMQI